MGKVVKGEFSSVNGSGVRIVRDGTETEGGWVVYESLNVYHE